MRLESDVGIETDSDDGLLLIWNICKWLNFVLLIF